MNVLIVGINPPQKSKTKNGIAFPTECRSRKTLDAWFKPIVKVAAEVYQIEVTFYYKNVSDTYTKNNRLPDVSDEDMHTLKFLSTEYDRIIACGRFPAKILKELGIKHLEIDHPSGLNRALNDLNRVQNLKLRLREYIINGRITSENECLISTHP